MHLISTEKDLLEFSQELKKCSYISIDTEFLRYKTFYPKLCLIQIATDDTIALIDSLAISNLKIIFDVIYNPNIMWIAHASRNDIESLFPYSKKIPKKLFDTQIASKLLNYGDQISYNDLVEKKISVVLEKKYTRYKWDNRPIPQDVLQYAVDDVKFLIKLYKKLEPLISNSLLLPEYEKEINKILSVDLYNYENNDAWQKIKIKSALDKKELKKIRWLASIRENYAKKKNIPRQWVFSNKDLFLYARQTKKMDQKLYDKLVKDFV